MNARKITLEQYEKLIDTAWLDERELSDLLMEYAGIDAQPYTVYRYFDEYDNFIGTSDTCTVDELLDAAGVEVADDGKD